MKLVKLENLEIIIKFLKLPKFSKFLKFPSAGNSILVETKKIARSVILVLYGRGALFYSG